MALNKCRDKRRNTTVIIDMENEGADDIYQFTLSQSSQGERKYKKKPRGTTQMNELIIKRSDNKKEVVAYNEWGQLTGDEGKHLVSFCGLMVRRKIPINIDKWMLVPTDLKDEL
ncbi:hypothetical protein PanWU01x14_330570 [Parasponia andersonii]|uniref:Uncharacterized protein n=1 Tax=Parasponia andersonii TaxID=3476 RepID=A0A2P5AI05_PARAD|nr:hypothetical protein PanWU01x14_330570 [Parasponia andersonii]